MQVHILSFEGPDAYARAGGLATRVTGLAAALAAAGCNTHLWFIGAPALPGHETRVRLRLHPSASRPTVRPRNANACFPALYRPLERDLACVGRVGAPATTRCSRRLKAQHKIGRRWRAWRDSM